jgi:hypothetical protein
MEADPSSTHLDRAYQALESERWSEAAALARGALVEAEAGREESDAALARFILGTALAGSEGSSPGELAEAREHLQAALPRLQEEDEPDLVGQAWALLGGLSLIEARAGERSEALAQADQCYRRALEAYAEGDDAVGHCGALHNLGLCLAARSEEPGLHPEARARYVDDALVCFHDALELEVEWGLEDLAAATEEERRRVQGFRDEVRGWAV